MIFEEVDLPAIQPLRSRRVLYIFVLTSGIPYPVDTLSYPWILAPFDPFSNKAVRIHTEDMYIGIALIAAGIILKIASDKKILYVPYSKLMAYVLLTPVWVYFLLPKILSSYT